MGLQIQDVNALLIIPKGIEALILMALVVLLTKQLLAQPKEERYILNKLFIVSFICWGSYMICDAILYPLAAVPFSDYVGDIPLESQITGYPIEYPHVYIAQVLRDISMVLVFITAFMYFSSSIVIMKGENWTRKNIFKNSALIFVCLFLVALIVISDQIGVSKTGNDILVSEKWGSFEGGLSLILLILIFLASAIILFRTMANIENTDSIFRKRTMLIGLGILVVAMGGIYWIIFGITRGSEGVFFTNEELLFYTFIGHGIWTISPLLIYAGLKPEKNLA